MPTDKELRRRAGEINTLVYGLVCDTTLTAGETLTVLNWVKNTVDEQVRDCQERIRQRTGIKQDNTKGE